jgi:hypothetical protein
MKAVGLVEGIVTRKTKLPGAFWSLHEREGDLNSKGDSYSILASDDLFKVLAGEGIGEVRIYRLTAGTGFNVGTSRGGLWMIVVVSGILEVLLKSNEDQIGQTRKLLAGQGIGSYVPANTVTGEVLADTLMLFVDGVSDTR